MLSGWAGLSLFLVKNSDTRHHHVNSCLWKVADSAFSARFGSNHFCRESQLVLGKLGKDLT